MHACQLDCSFDAKEPLTVRPLIATGFSSSSSAFALSRGYCTSQVSSAELRIREKVAKLPRLDREPVPLLPLLVRFSVLLH